MCRNIKSLYNFEPPATEEEINLAALQFVRKITGYTKPSKINEAPFNSAVAKIEDIINSLFQDLQTKAKPRSREKEAEKARKNFERRIQSLKDL